MANGVRRRVPTLFGLGALTAFFGLWALSGLLVFELSAQDVARGDGVFADSIVFGQSAAFSGPSAQLGRGMNLGLLAAFEEANRAGGIGGRRLRLATRDDGYEPEAAAANTRELLDLGVFGLLGPVGTPTSLAAAPIAESAEVPYVGAFTGASILRGANNRFVVNVRASYDQETEEMVERLTRDLGIRRIAILYQKDAYGLAGLAGVRAALARRNMSLAAEATYLRNTLAVKQALLDLIEVDPEAVIIIGVYNPAAEFIRWSRKLGEIDPVFVNISFVGSDALRAALGGNGDGVVVTQVVPFPEDASVPVVAQYQEALAAVDPEARPGFVSLEGYLAGRLVRFALEQMHEAGEDPPSRAGFLAALRDQETIDLGGFALSYSALDNQGSDQVFLTVMRGGRLVPVQRLSRR